MIEFPYFYSAVVTSWISDSMYSLIGLIKQNKIKIYFLQLKSFFNIKLFGSKDNYGFL